MPTIPTSLRLIFCSVTLALIAIGCGGGGATVPPPTAPPVIAAVTPSGPVGIETDAVTFAATASNNPTSWQWNFGGASAGAATSTDATPSITLGLTSTWECSVVATNSLGSSEPYRFSVAIDPASTPVISAVTPTGAIGATGQVVTFEPTVDIAGLTWSWNFGGGAIPNISSERSPRVTLRDKNPAGNNIAGSVSATRPGTSAPPVTFAFEYSVARQPVMATVMELPNHRAYDAATVGGNPIALLSYGDSYPLMVGVGQNPTPGTHLNWNFHDLLPYGVDRARIAVDGNHLIIAWVEPGPGTLHVALANASDGLLPGGWSMYAMPGDNYARLDVEYIAGKPIVVAAPHSAPVQVWVAAIETPSTTAEWRSLQLFGQDTWGFDLAGSGTQGAVLAWDLNALGETNIPQVAVTHPGRRRDRVSDWTTGPLTAMGTGDESLASSAALAWHASTLGALYVTKNGVELATSRVPVPAGPDDWTRGLVAPVEAIEPGMPPTAPARNLALMSTADGWAATYMQERKSFSSLSSFSTLRLARSRTLSPTGPTDWQTLEAGGEGGGGSHSGGSSWLRYVCLLETSAGLTLFWTVQHESYGGGFHDLYTDSYWGRPIVHAEP